MTNNLPTIAIVTPSFNQGAFLEETMLSILNQGYDGLHYTVMDGGSTDNSLAVLQQYGSRIDYWESRTDNGQSDAIASGFERSDCEVMGWVNSDDFLLPGALHCVGEFFASHPDVEVVSCGALTVDNDSRYVLGGFGCGTRGVAASYDRFRFLEAQDGVFQMATFWRRSAYNAVGGLDRELRFTMDLDLFTKMAKRQRFSRLRQYVACFRLHGDSKSSSIQHIRRAELSGYRKRFKTAEMSLSYRHVRRFRYRIPSLARKIGLRWQRCFEVLPEIGSLGETHAP